MASNDEQLLPGLPNDVALECLARLPLDTTARCRAVSRSWVSALTYLYSSASRPPLSLACLCTARVNSERQSSFAWLFLSPSHLRSNLVPFYSLPSAFGRKLHAFSSQTQVMATGTNLLLVRSRLQFTGRSDHSPQRSSSNGDLSCASEALLVGGHLASAPGALQGFDVWQMKWCSDVDRPVPCMHVDRWGFATAHVGKHVYVAGGEGPGAARSVERLDLETGVWEVLPDMIQERGVNPTGFVLDGCFYVAGGEFQPTTSTEGRGLSQSGEYFDPEKGVWTFVEGMWPEELWGCGESVSNVVVVKDMALSATLTEVMMLSVAGGRRWEARGRLPHEAGLERWYLHVVRGNNDELWVVMSGKAGRPWLAYACKPQLAAEDGLLHWEHRPFDIPPSTPQGVLASVWIRL